MKAIFSDAVAVYTGKIWESDHGMLMDALNSRLMRERKSLEEKDYSVDFAVKVARKQIPSLEFVEEELCE